MRSIIIVQAALVSALCIAHLALGGMSALMAAVLSCSAALVAVASIGWLPNPLARRIAKRRWSKAIWLKEEMQENIRLIERAQRWGCKPATDDYLPHDAD